VADPRNTPADGCESKHALNRRTSGSAASSPSMVGTTRHSHWPLAGRLRHNGRMDITLNGEPRSLATPVTVHELLQAEGLVERRVAVEVNGSIVPRGRHATHPLADGDRVEIVHALGGG